MRSIVAIVACLVAITAARGQVAAPISGRQVGPPLAVANGEAGWTKLAPSADSVMIYVSAGTGNDSADGTRAHPLKSLAVAYSRLRDGCPDWMLLKAGDVWDGAMPMWGKSGRSASEPMVVWRYGDGARPLLRTGTAIGLQAQVKPLRFVSFCGFALASRTASGWTTSRGEAGISWVCSGGSVLFEDLDVEGYRNNVILQGWPTTERLRGAIFRRCTLWNPLKTDVGNVNIYADFTDGLELDECLLVNLKSNDSLTAGVGIGTRMAHNAYLHESNGPLKVIGNIAYNARTNFTARPGGIVRDNLSVRGGQGFQIGWDTYRASTVTGNVCCETRNHHNGQPLGQGFVLSHQEQSDVSGNIVAHATDGTGPEGFRVEADNRAFTLAGNVVYDWAGGPWECPGLFLNGEIAARVVVDRNDFQHLEPKYDVYSLAGLGGVLFSGNRYWTPQPAMVLRGSEPLTFTQWAAVDPTGSWLPVVYQEPERSAATYAASLGHADVEAFLIDARNNRRGNWRTRYTADAVVRYVREGFGR